MRVSLAVYSWRRCGAGQKCRAVTGLLIGAPHAGLAWCWSSSDVSVLLAGGGALIGWSLSWCCVLALISPGTWRWRWRPEVVSFSIRGFCSSSAFTYVVGLPGLFSSAGHEFGVVALQNMIHEVPRCEAVCVARAGAARDGVEFATFDVVVHGSGGPLWFVLRVVCVASAEGCSVGVAVGYLSLVGVFGWPVCLSLCLFVSCAFGCSPAF